MPPAALISSAAIMMPLCVDCPKVAWGPVIEPYSPTRMSPLPAAVVVFPPFSFGGQPSSPNDSTAMEMRMSKFLRIGLLFKELRIVQQGPFLESGWAGNRVQVGRTKSVGPQAESEIREPSS